MCTRCLYGIFGGDITKYTVIYGAYIRFWPTLCTHTITAFGFVYTQFLTGLVISRAKKASRSELCRGGGPESTVSL